MQSPSLKAIWLLHRFSRKRQNNQTGTIKMNSDRSRFLLLMAPVPLLTTNHVLPYSLRWKFLLFQDIHSWTNQYNRQVIVNYTIEDLAVLIQNIVDSSGHNRNSSAYLVVLSNTTSVQKKGAYKTTKWSIIAWANEIHETMLHGTVSLLTSNSSRFVSVGRFSGPLYCRALLRWQPAVFR